MGEITGQTATPKVERQAGGCRELQFLQEDPVMGVHAFVRFTPRSSTRFSWQRGKKNPLLPWQGEQKGTTLN